MVQTNHQRRGRSKILCFDSRFFLIIRRIIVLIIDILTLLCWLMDVPTCMRKACNGLLRGPPDFTCQRQDFSFLKPWILRFAKRDKIRGMADWRC